ncbi:MAG: iron chelate uptake ABC transporter family permease subunit [Gloeotrichia echinulata IR180]
MAKSKLRFPARMGKIGVRESVVKTLHKNVLVATLMLCLSLLLTIAISQSIRAVAMTPGQLWQALFHQGDVLYQTIFWDLRLPRTLAAILVGAALGMSGKLLQGMLRNSLADPFLLGISAGAGLVAIGFFSLGLLQTWVPLAAWAGSLLITLFIWLLYRRYPGI